MTSEHERIVKNKKSISIINRRLDQIENLVGESKVQPFFTARPTYSFVFGGTPFELGGAVAAGAWTKFDGCDEFCKNTTDKPQTVTINIHNTSTKPMEIDIKNDKQAKIEAGKTVLLIFEIPAGESLHADENGEYQP